MKHAALALLALASWSENRYWLVELELRGPCDEVRLDCGPDGETRLLGPFPAGEARHMSVAVPARSPLGAEGLASLPLPRATAVPPEAGGTAVIRGWSPHQPAENVARLGNSALARARPVLEEPAARAGPGTLALALAAGAVLLLCRARKRLALTVALALAAGLALFARTRTAAPSTATEERLLEADTEAGQALAVSVSSGVCRLPRAWLEVEPEGRALEFRVERSGTEGRAQAPGTRLTTLGLAPAPALEPARNDYADLERVWTREPGGAWVDRGAWPRGEPLGPPREDEPEAPPGWLVSPLAPGRGVLVAHGSGGGWVRILGFAPADGD